MAEAEAVEPGELDDDREVIRPQPGPQWDCLASPADVIIFGGAHFGGKSFATHLYHLKYAQRPHYTGLTLRKEATQFKGPGGLWEIGKEIFAHLGASFRETPVHDVKFPGGGTVQFAGMAGPSDVEKFRGKSFCVIAVDEAQQIPGMSILFLLKSLRTPPGYDGPVRMVLTCNPPAPGDAGHDLLMELVDWFIREDGYPELERCGQLRWFTVENGRVVWVDEDWRDPQDPTVGPKSLTLIPAIADDNPIGLAANPGYKASLRAQSRSEMLRGLRGNWRVSESGSMFDRGEVVWVDRSAVPDGLKQVRYWDQGLITPGVDRQSFHCPTAGARVGWHTCTSCHGWRFIGEQPCGLCNSAGRHPRPNEPQIALWLTDLVERYGTPSEIEALMRQTGERDGRDVPIYVELERGSAAVANLDSLKRRALAAFEVHGDRPTGDKSTRAQPLASLAEQGLLFAVRGLGWDSLLMHALRSFRHDNKGEHLDVVDSITGGMRQAQAHEWTQDLAWAFPE